MINNIIFDFNGTMVFDSDLHVKAWNALSLELRGMPITPEEMNTKVHGVPNIKVIEYLTNGQLGSEEMTNLSRKKEALYRKFLVEKQLPLVDGLEAFLNTNKLPISIATASIYENIIFFYEYYNLKRYLSLDNLIYDNDLYVDKKQMFIDAANSRDCEINNSLVFEDSNTGVEKAIMAGAKNIILLYDVSYNETIAKMEEVKFVANNFKDIQVFLNNSKILE